MYWNNQLNFDENIKILETTIRKDYYLTDEDATQLLSLLHKITPDTIIRYASISLVASKCTKLIIIQNKLDGGTITIKYNSFDKYKIICYVGIILVVIPLLIYCVI